MRRLAWILIVLLALPAGGARAAQKDDSVVVGVLQRMSGAFFSDMWGLSSVDMDVRSAIHGYSTVMYTGSGGYQPDMSVLSDMQTSKARQGDVTYTFTIKPGLVFSDGVPVTARDYVFSILLQSSSQANALGAAIGRYRHLAGYAAYASGSTGVFSGVRLLGDDRFAMTIEAVQLPIFTELLSMRVTPYPIHIIAPGCQVTDDGEGASVLGLTADSLRQTLLGDDGYLRHPLVSCGPYSLKSFDDEASVAMLEANPLYQGDAQGKKPEIQSITIKTISEEDVLPMLASGELDIVNKLSEKTLIDGALALVSERSLKRYNYPRNGFSFLSLSCELGVTRFEPVRRAIAMCLDEAAITNEYLGVYGMQVYGCYGIGQWMTVEKSEEIAQMNTLAANVNAAKTLLIEDGWVLDMDGNPYDEDAGGVRHKYLDGVLTPLRLMWVKTEGSSLCRIIERQLAPELALAGFDLATQTRSADEILKLYYRQQPRTQNMLVMGTNFGDAFDPYSWFNTEDQYQGVYNTSGIRDTELMMRAAALRHTSGEDLSGYADKWLALQKRWNALMPAVPLFSGIYFDFVQPDLYGYAILNSNGFGASLVYLSRDPSEGDMSGQLTEQAVGLNP